MDVARPYAAVSPTLDGEVLRVLAATSMLMTGREVARRTGRSSHSGVLDVLHRLTDHGLVTRVELNRAFLFALNRDHVAAPAVELLAGLRAELFSRIRRAIGDWEIAPVYAAVFGSTARADGDVDSDIDLLLVRSSAIEPGESRWQAQVEDLRRKIEGWSGNGAGIVEVSETGLARLRDEERPIIAELCADAIVVGGSDVTALLEPA
jgi:hypothetical protein